MQEYEGEDGAVFISEVRCTGLEETLTACPHREARDHECDNAGVTCRASGVDIPQNSGGTVAGAVIGTLAFLVLVAIVVVVPLVFISHKLHKKKALEKMQLDIHAL